jgi:hypothetical protein
LNDPEAVCRAIYDETRHLYADVVSDLGPAGLGFRILYGPPIVGAPYLFIGYQPGGKARDAIDGLAAGHHNGWPVRSDFATAPWRLASEMRRIWGTELIDSCPGLNAIFFRSTTMKDWRQLPPALRERLEDFSRERVRRIVEVLDPRHLIVIGLGTFNMLTAGDPIVCGATGRILAKCGELWGRPATGIVHLSGSRISRADRAILQAHFAAKHSSCGSS